MAEELPNDYFSFSRSLELHEILEVGIHIQEGFVRHTYPIEQLPAQFGWAEHIECGFTGDRPYLYNFRSKQFVFIGGEGAEALFKILNVEFSKRQRSQNLRPSRARARQFHPTLEDHLREHYHVSEGLNLRDHFRAYGLFESEEADELYDLSHLIAGTGNEGTIAEGNPTGRTGFFEVDEVPGNNYRVRHTQDPGRTPLTLEDPTELLPILGKLIREKCHGFDYESWIAMQAQAEKDD